MSRPRGYSGELEFLNLFTEPPGIAAQSAPWLMSSFDSNQWKCCFGSFRQIDLDFAIRLNHCALLTDARRRSLLTTIKRWLCVQSDSVVFGSRIVSDKTHYSRVRKTAHLIDFFLLRAKQYRLATHGFALIDEDALIGVMHAISEPGGISEGVYEWSRRLAAFLRSNIDCEKESLLELVEDKEFLREGIAIGPSNLTDLSADEILLARAWMIRRRIYKHEKAGSGLLSPNTSMLHRLVFSGGTLLQPLLPVPHEFLIDSREKIGRQHVASPIRGSSKGSRDHRSIATYMRSLNSLSHLANRGNGLQVENWAVLDDGLIRQLCKRSLGRYRSLPAAVVLGALRNAIEFTLTYGTDLIASFLEILRAAKESGRSFNAYIFSEGIDRHLTAKVQAMGVRAWTLKPSGRFISDTTTRLPYAGDYFEALRANIGLYECLLVLFGSVRIAVGALSARRQDELDELMVPDCLVMPGPFLRFRNCKSGPLSTRETLVRPIPDIVARLIRILEPLQLGLVELGIREHPGRLFSRPRLTGSGLEIVGAGKGAQRELDYFCDYFQTALDSNGRRYYLRDHQLRRFFAMMFFWSSSFGGLETLRWYLGHTDMRHVYHYITESTPGAVLRDVKVQYVVEAMQSKATEVDDLLILIRHRYGTDDFSVLDADELNEYVEDLIQNEHVQVEPEFFCTPTGESFRVAVKVLWERGRG